MSTLRDVARELLSMFAADGLLTIETLLLVAVITGLVLVAKIEPLIGGGLMLCGCLAILVQATIREARRRSS